MLKLFLHPQLMKCQAGTDTDTSWDTSVFADKQTETWRVRDPFAPYSRWCGSWGNQNLASHLFDGTTNNTSSAPQMEISLENVKCEHHIGDLKATLTAIHINGSHWLAIKKAWKYFFFTSVYWFSSLLDRHTIIKLAVAKKIMDPKWTSQRNDEFIYESCILETSRRSACH